MNPRIKELIEQCTDIVEIVNPDTDITHHREFFDREKFALLIVRECLGKVAEAAHARRDPFFAYSQILEHFGVEE